MSEARLGIFKDVISLIRRVTAGVAGGGGTGGGAAIADPSLPSLRLPVSSTYTRFSSFLHGKQSSLALRAVLSLSRPPSRLMGQ